MKNGEYTLVIAPESYPGKKYRDKYCYEHHLVWWENGNRLPGEGELLHHKNDIKRDNRIGNLDLITIAEHNRIHCCKNNPNTSCDNCGIPFRVKPYKLKRKHRFCSLPCVGFFNFPGRAMISSS